jgi:hypothetical protein
MEPADNYYTVRGLSFKKFLEMDFEVILTGVYLHEETFAALIKKHKPNAKLIRQIANIHEKPLGFCKNILLGAAYHPTDFEMEPSIQRAFAKRGERVFVYYPEHHSGYSYTPPSNSKTVICLSKHIASEDRVMWELYKRDLEKLGFVFKMYGGQYEPYEIDPIYGSVISHLLLPKAIKEAGFVWYTKPHGGGGFTVRQALSIGRPVIVRKRYSSAHTIIESELFRHGTNCIDLDLSSDTSMMRTWSQPSVHAPLCRRVADLFQRDVQFEKISKQVKDWINRLPRGI